MLNNLLYLKDNARLNGLRRFYSLSISITIKRQLTVLLWLIFLTTTLISWMIIDLGLMIGKGSADLIGDW